MALPTLVQIQSFPLRRHSTVVVRHLGKMEVLSSSLSDGFGTRLADSQEGGHQWDGPTNSKGKTLQREGVSLAGFFLPITRLQFYATAYLHV